MSRTFRYSYYTTGEYLHALDAIARAWGAGELARWCDRREHRARHAAWYDRAAATMLARALVLDTAYEATEVAS